MIKKILISLSVILFITPFLGFAAEKIKTKKTEVTVTKTTPVEKCVCTNSVIFRKVPVKIFKKVLTVPSYVIPHTIIDSKPLQSIHVVANRVTQRSVNAVCRIKKGIRKTLSLLPIV